MLQPVTWLAETTMLIHGWRRFVLLLVAGAVAGLSVPPFFVLPALFVAMPIWVWALDGAERARLWQALLAKAPGFGQYEHKTTRVIPVVRIEPA